MIGPIKYNLGNAERGGSEQLSGGYMHAKWALSWYNAASIIQGPPEKINPEF